MTYQDRAPDQPVQSLPARRRRRRLTTPVAGVVAGAALAAGLSGCGTAPAAAIVNGQKISIQQLDQRLQDWASSPAFRRAYDQNMLQQAAQSGNSNPVGVTVEGSGTGSRVYGREWVATELTMMIDATAIAQYLSAHHLSPSPAQVSAAWAAEYASSPQMWRQLPAEARTQAALEDAQAAVVYGKAVSAPTDKQFYDSHKSDFWSQVCVATANVIVTGKNGQVDQAASKHQASAEARAWASGQHPSSGAPAGGARACYSGEHLLEQGASFFGMVNRLKVGAAAAVAASPGYQVVRVLSRRTIPFAGWNAPVIELVVQHGGNHYEPPIGQSGLDNVIRRAKVSVNIAYGAWARSGQAQVSYVNPGVLH